MVQINGTNAGTGTASAIFGVAKTAGGMTVRGISLTNTPAPAIRGLRTVFNAQFWNPDNITANITICYGLAILLIFAGLISLTKRHQYQPRA